MRGCHITQSPSSRSAGKGPLLSRALLGTGCACGRAGPLHGHRRRRLLRSYLKAPKGFLKQRVGQPGIVQCAKSTGLHHVSRSLSTAMCVLCGNMVLSSRSLQPCVDATLVLLHSFSSQHDDQEAALPSVGSDAAREFLPSYSMVPVPGHPHAGPQNPGQIHTLRSRS